MPADTITHLLIEYRYWIVVPLAFMEGPIVALNVGVLMAFGYFNPFIVSAIFLVREVTLDAVCYLIGRYGEKSSLVEKYGPKIGLTKEHWDAVEHLWQTHPGKTMFVSKLAYGLSWPFLISAGMTRMPYSRFWYYAIQVTFFQYGGLLILGYYFANSYSIIATSVKGLEYLLLGIVILSVIIYALSNHMRRRLLRMKEEEEKKAAD